MGERKVLNKYFPPDFDPSLIPRRQRPKNQQIEVRMMLPFSIQCDTCGEYMYRGKKFNSRKEDVVEENYLGLRIFRFYIKCVQCSSEITFKTDPKKGDYVAEHGCSRNFEPWRETEAAEEEALKKKEAEEKGDSMKALENRTLDSKREMDILDALDEIRAINQRHAKVDTDALLQNMVQKDENLEKEEEQKQLEEDLRQAKLAFQQKQQQATAKRKLTSDATNGAAAQPPTKKPTLDGAFSIGQNGNATVPTTKQQSTTTLPGNVIVIKKKNDAKNAAKSSTANAKKMQVKAPPTTSLVADYSDSSDG